MPVDHQAVETSPQGMVTAQRLPTAQAPPNAPLDALLTAIEREPQRWHWQQGAGEPQAMTDALQRWLAQLSHATAGAWVAVTPRADSGPAAGDAPFTLRLLLDGEQHTLLRLGTGSVWADATSAPRGPAQAVIGQPAEAALTQALGQALSAGAR